MSLYDLSKSEAQEDVFRLKGLDVVVTTAEQLAKARIKAPGIQPSMQLKVSWQPMTYRKYIGDELVTEEVDYIKMTANGKINDGNVELVRQARLKVAGGMLYKLPNNITKAQIDKQEMPYSRFMVAAVKAGLLLDPTDDGGVTSKQVDQLFRCRVGYEEFPTVNEGGKGKDFWNWDDTRGTYLRIPLALVTDFVQPAEADMREFRYERKDESDEGGAAATTTTSGTAVTDNDVKAALRAIGISGKPAMMINANALAIVTAQVGTHRALATLIDAAQSSDFTAALVDKGLATVEDGNLVVA